MIGELYLSADNTIIHFSFVKRIRLARIFPVVFLLGSEGKQIAWL